MAVVVDGNPLKSGCALPHRVERLSRLEQRKLYAPSPPDKSARLALCGQLQWHCRVSPGEALHYWLSQSHLNA